MLVQFRIIGFGNEHCVVIEKMDFLLIAHADVRMSAQKVMQRCRAGLLAPARIKASRSILRRLVRNISEMYIAKPVGEADSFPAIRPRTNHVVVALVRALYYSRMYKWFCRSFAVQSSSLLSQ